MIIISKCFFIENYIKKENMIFCDFIILESTVFFTCVCLNNINSYKFLIYGNVMIQSINNYINTFGEMQIVSGLLNC